VEKNVTAAARKLYCKHNRAEVGTESMAQDLNLQFGNSKGSGDNLRTGDVPYAWRRMILNMH
jgi:hypothetical protein